MIKLEGKIIIGSIQLILSCCFDFILLRSGAIYSCIVTTNISPAVDIYRMSPLLLRLECFDKILELMGYQMSPRAVFGIQKNLQEDLDITQK